MKITKEQLRKIIKEEIKQLTEANPFKDAISKEPATKMQSALLKKGYKLTDREGAWYYEYTKHTCAIQEDGIFVDGKYFNFSQVDKAIAAIK